MCVFNDLKVVYLLLHLGKVQVNGFYRNYKETQSKKSHDAYLYILWYLNFFTCIIMVYYLMLRNIQRAKEKFVALYTEIGVLSSMSL